MGKKTKPTSTDFRKTAAPFTTTAYPHDVLNKTVNKVTESALNVKNNPQLMVDWAKEHPVSAAGMTGLAVGSYVGYSQMTGEYKIPAYEFNVRENTTVKIEGGVGLNGEVKEVGISFRWKF